MIRWRTLVRVPSSEWLSWHSVRNLIRNGSACLVAALLTVIVLGIRFQVDETAFREAERDTKSLRLVLEANADMISLLKDAETRQREYLLTGAIHGSEPYANSQVAVLKSLAGLAEATHEAHSPAEENVERLALLLSDRLDAMRRSIHRYDMAEPRVADELPSTSRDRQVMDEIRLLSADINAQESARLQLSSHALQHAMGTSHSFVSIGGALLVCLLVLASVVVRLDVLRLTALREELAARNSRLLETARELEQANKSLSTTNAALRLANEDIEQFAYSSAHELQEPLRMISMFTQSLANSLCERLDDREREYMHYVIASAKRMSSLVSDALNYTTLALSTPDLQPQEMGRVLKEAIVRCTALIQDAGVNITYDRLPTVYGESSQLVLLLQHLITNSLRYRSDAPLQINISAAQWNGGEYLFSVEDNGRGFHMRYREEIFGLFKRLQRDEAGTGTGLAVCKRIVERHGGKIWAVSEPGKGSQFFFTLAIPTEPATPLI